MTGGRAVERLRVHTVVDDFKRHERLGVGQAEPRRRRGDRVLEDIGERLLCDPVDGELDGRRQREPFPGDGPRRRQPGDPDLVDQVVDLGDARLRRARAGVAVVAQYAEQPVHLVQCLPSGGRDVFRRGFGLFGVGPRGERGPVGERDHHRQIVRHDVVHLAGDPGSLARGGDLRLLVPFALGPDRPVLQRSEVRPPGPDVEAEHERGGDHGGDEDEAGSGFGKLVIARNLARDDHGEDGECQQRAPPLRMCPDGVDGDEHREHGRRELRAEHPLEHGERGGGAEHGQREAAPQRQGADQHDAEHEQVRPRAGQHAPPLDEHGERQQRAGQQQVDGHRMPAGQGTDPVRARPQRAQPVLVCRPHFRLGHRPIISRSAPHGTGDVRHRGA